MTREFGSIVVLATALAFAFAFSFSACGGEGTATTDTFPAAAYETLASASGAYTIEVRTSPQPPQVGVGSVELYVRDRGGVAADGLAFQVTSVMPAHSHGASVHPTIEPKGAGVYVLHDVSTYMPGKWELHAAIGGPASDEAVIVLDVH
ncbi:hypothetical protein BH09MYX1_BH09MYX1_11530 [soil metagenome]